MSKVRRWLGNTGQLAPQLENTSFFLIGAAVTVFLFLYFGSRDSSYAVTATTHGATVRFAAYGNSSWRFVNAKVCVRRLGGNTSGEQQRGTDCDPRFYTQVEVGPLEITWREGALVMLRRTSAEEPLEILVVDPGRVPTKIGETDLTANSIIFVSPADWARSGALAFDGVLTIGAFPSPGTVDHLVAGRYEIREVLLGRSYPTRLRTEELFTGDQISFVSHASDNAVPEQDALVTGFVTASSQDGALLVQAYTPAGENALRIDRMGGMPPTFVAASWSDRALNDPWLLGLTALYGLLSQLRGIGGWFRTANKNNNEK